MNWLSNPDFRGLFWLPASFAVSALLTLLAIGYARRNNVIDQPGQRRSHSSPTPRGGGIGIVLSVLLGLGALALLLPEVTLPLRLMGSIALLAAIGWIDDHRPLPAWLRLLVQFAAVAVWLLPLLRVVLSPPDVPDQQLDTSTLETAGIATLLGFLTLWSINLHNFMDGIDGLLAAQAIFVLGALAWLALRDAESMRALQLGMWVAALAGFLPFNFPRARVFMGDVGSGVVGLLVAVAVLWQTSIAQVAAATGFIAVSAFAVDATCTLLSRMLGGRRWYRAHREHLYQWLARSGMSHARVVAWYMGWNLLVVAPVLYWINRMPVTRKGAPVTLDSGIGWAIAVYALGLIVWICGKRWCLRRAKSFERRRELEHAPA